MAGGGGGWKFIPEQDDLVFFVPEPINASQVVPLSVPVDVANNVSETEETYEINPWLGQDLVSGGETH